MTHLPEADAHALATSLQLVETIRQEIRAAGGWLSFARYMELALYAPGLGYYAAGSHKLGAAGDFTTAPEMTPLFGQALAAQISEILPHTAGELVEFGAGTGVLAVDVLRELERRDCLPSSYTIIDLSPDLVERQRTLIDEKVPHLASRVRWADRLPDTISGVVIGNEVLDAMPCHLIGWQDAYFERGVRDSGDPAQPFAWEDRPLSDPALLQLAGDTIPPLPGYLSELSLANRAFIGSLAERLTAGGILLIDYGFPASQYYHPQRSMGTLIGHYRHHTVDDPFFLPGLMDLTCHVDFSAIATCGLEAGLELIGYTTQAQFLLNCGILASLEAIGPDNAARYLPHASAVQKLLSVSEMGELFKVIGFGRQAGIDWRGFLQGDRCFTL